MIIRAHDKKKERLIIISTIVGVLLIGCVWAFQIRTLFTDTMAKETRDSNEQMQAIVTDLSGFQDELETKMPVISESFNGLVDYFKLEYEAELAKSEAQKQAQEQALEQVSGDVADLVAQETVERMNEELE